MKQWLDENKILTRATFFRLGVFACLVVSVWHGTHLFQTTQENGFFGIDISILIAGTIDLGLWFLIDAMLQTRKRGETIFSLIILVGIVLLCGLSFVANYTYNQHFFSPHDFTNVEYLSRQGVTLLQSSPPLIIIFLSIVGEVFIRPDEEEVQDYETVLTNKFMRSVIKMEARLKAEKRKREILEQYTTKEGTQTAIVQPLRFSFMGVKIYGEPIQQVQPQTKVDDDTHETLKQIAVFITKLDQHFSTSVTTVREVVQIEEGRNTDKIQVVQMTEQEEEELFGKR